MALIKFVRNYDDLSTERGYQFKFYCDKCGNGYMSKFITSTTGLAEGALRAAGSFFGGILGRAAGSADEVARMARGKGHDQALEQAVGEAKVFFKQCSRCGNWVCPEMCWNAEKGLCEACAPNFAEELAAGQAKEKARQAEQKLAQSDLLNGEDVTAEALVRCPKCDAQVKAGKFCPECGGQLQEKISCAKCGKAVPKGVKFCPECGAPASAPSACKCGAKLEPGTKFCPGCGQKVG